MSMDTELDRQPIFQKKVLYPNSRNLMIALLLGSDVVSIMFAGFIAVTSRLFLLGNRINYELFWQVIPLAFLCIVVFILRGLYPGVGLGPVGELRRIITSITAVVIGFAAVTFFARNPEDYSRLTIGMTWVISLVMVPFGRAVTRNIGDRLNFWGEPIVVIGSGNKGQELVTYLKTNRKFGLRPVLLVDGCQDIPTKNRLTLGDFNSTNLTEKKSLPKNISTALVVLPEVDAHIVEAVTDQQFGDFNRVILVTDLDHISKLGVTTFDLNGTLGLEVHQNLLNLSAQIQKWIMDMVLSIIVLVVLFPLFVLVGLLIKLTSKGPIFYSHSRIGQGGKHFNIFKFRTMYQNADQMLEKYLEENPQYREEWETEQKIRKDPRITPIGRILRKLSIDELPQVWNVIRGEMSLVGPRPIVDDEIEKYADKFAVYKRVKTGITGLWQVSGRNNLPYEERIRLDEYYVRNWSIWLDVYIMARTIWVVLGRDGAY